MNKIFIFVAGAITGSLVAWKMAKDKYKKLADEEIASVKETFAKRLSGDADKEPSDDVDEVVMHLTTAQKPKPSAEIKAKYQEIINTNNYGGDKVMRDKPYVIPPEEFGENPDYETVSLTYYADQVLTDQDNFIIDPGEIDDMIGEESLDTFGTYEEDSVFVRNEERMTDYEILLDARCYDDN